MKKGKLSKQRNLWYEYKNKIRKWIFSLSLESRWKIFKFSPKDLRLLSCYNVLKADSFMIHENFFDYMISIIQANGNWNIKFCIEKLIQHHTLLRNLIRFPCRLFGSGCWRGSTNRLTPWTSRLTSYSFGACWPVDQVVRLGEVWYGKILT